MADVPENIAKAIDDATAYTNALCAFAECRGDKNKATPFPDRIPSANQWHFMKETVKKVEAVFNLVKQHHSVPVPVAGGRYTRPPSVTPANPTTSVNLRIEDARKKITDDSLTTANSFNLFISPSDTIVLSQPDVEQQKKAIADKLNINVTDIRFIKPRQGQGQDNNSNNGSPADLRFIVNTSSFADKMAALDLIKGFPWRHSVRLSKYLHQFAKGLRQQYAMPDVQQGVKKELLFKPNRDGTRLIVLHRDPKGKFEFLESFLNPIPTNLADRKSQDLSSSFLNDSSLETCIPKTLYI